MNNTTEPIIGAQYEWQGEPCAIVDVESKYRWLNFYEHLVTVEYFNKDAGQWRRVKTPWLSGAFKLMLAPAPTPSPDAQQPTRCFNNTKLALV